MTSDDTRSSPPTGSVGTLDLSSLPPIFVSATHFQTDDLHEFEEALTESNATLTYDINEARIVLSKATKIPRIKLDLRSKGLWTEEVKPSELDDEPAAKRRKIDAQVVKPKDEVQAIVIDDSSTESEAEADVAARSEKSRPGRAQAKVNAPVRTPSPESTESIHIVKVVHVQWFTDCKQAGKVLPLEDYLSYRGRRIDRPKDPSTPDRKTAVQATSPSTKKTTSPKSILARAKEDSPSPTHASHTKRKFGHNTPTTKAPSSTTATWSAGHTSNPKYAHLLHTTTTEHDDGYSSDLPEMPDWVRRGVKYACQRSTPSHNPNEAFIAQLKKIRVARELTNDEIGVRAYSTCIASLSAYPYKLTSPREVIALPGCDTKLANLFVEFMNEGSIAAVTAIEADEDLKVLRLFYDIWGVGATTAREFYYERGWKELDDIVEFGWSTLTRVQQIGVKFYDEFLDLIPKAEVEEIGRVVHEHAVKVRDEGIQSLIVGGYRRGKEASGDVDIIVSHPEEEKTVNIVSDIVASLEEEGWITHTLLLSLNGTHRGQQTLPFRSGGAGGGHGFDTLDKALVVWQDPSWPTKEADVAANPHAKNPDIHRRVDIIISPWRTVGCAVTGWSGGTTFQRDLRRYAKNVKGWKFDSSGVRSRVNGDVVDVERFGRDPAKTMVEAEKRVFEGLGLVYREPAERCTS